MSFNNIAKIIDGLTCPVSFEPLTKGVNLSCSHKVQQFVAEKLYGVMKDGVCEKKNKPCPVCTIEVKAYYPDLVIRSLAQNLFAFKEPENGLNLLATHPTFFENCKKKDTPGSFQVTALNLFIRKVH